MRKLSEKIDIDVIGKLMSMKQGKESYSQVLRRILKMSEPKEDDYNVQVKKRV